MKTKTSRRGRTLGAATTVAALVALVDGRFGEGDETAAPAAGEAAAADE
jgi:hypothetical protein